MPVAVLAGGLGTRMAGVVAEGIPKVLVPVAGRPFLDFKLASLAAQGVDRVVLLLGHGADRVAEYVGGGRLFGMEVGIVLDGPELLGTGGAVRRAAPHLGERFWVTYGDTYLRAPMAAAEAAFEGSGWAGLMTVFENADAWDRSNVRVEHGLVAEYRKGAPAGTFRYIDYGLLLLEAVSFGAWQEGEPFDLAEVLGRLVDQRRLGAFEVAERFYEVGTPAGWEEADAFLSGSDQWARLCSQTGPIGPVGGRTTSDAPKG
ncbi:MAG TPA: NTP transferase domain-containing protein [Actinomycetota bacterium]|jgi:NDP-sugar pyrophosphorylase family protein